MPDPYTWPMSEKNADRAMRLSAPIRRHYGLIFKGEPSILFRNDGTVRVTARDQTAELTAIEADVFGRDMRGTENHNDNPLLTAAIAVARSEAAASTPPPGEPEDHAHEPWPEMEALRAVLDVVRPGWRV